LRASFASYGNDRRAYYVWRMARFHGGVDTTIPFTASVRTHADPWVAELDAMADKVAEDQFGSNLQAAARWGRAFGVL
jgi:hypothetical protein